MTTRILYATNSGKPAAAAGVLLRRVADPARVTVTVNVCDSVEFAYPLRSTREETKPRPQPKDVASEEVARFEQEGFKADYHLGVGVPAGQILDQIELGSYNLTAMGAGSSSWLGNLLLGSTSMRVLHASESSVLIVHRFRREQGKVQVLLATDGSPDAELAVRNLLELANPAKVEVQVVSVANQVPASAAQYDDCVPPGEVLDHLQSKAVLAVDQAAQPLIDAGFAVAVDTTSGDPVRRILELAEFVDLVVVGSRGLGPAGRLALGSVSDQVARLAPAALVCRRLSAVRPPA
ncbi:MAG: universal stress protein [Actinobacteria bacterium]|nr:universal stress protein [Actinomycetota bacterium]